MLGGLCALDLGVEEIEGALTRYFSDYWILRPTAVLVSAVSGIEFVEEAGAGFFSRERLFLIAPACAGVNFFIAALCTAVFGFVGRVATPRAKLVLLLTGVLAAYATTLLANATRILIAIRLHRAEPFPFRDELFRVEGIAVYFVTLCAIYLGARLLLDRHHVVSQA